MLHNFLFLLSLSQITKMKTVLEPLFLPIVCFRISGLGQGLAPTVNKVVFII